MQINNLSLYKNLKYGYKAIIIDITDNDIKVLMKDDNDEYFSDIFSKEQFQEEFSYKGKIPTALKDLFNVKRSK